MRLSGTPRRVLLVGVALMAGSALAAPVDVERATARLAARHGAAVAAADGRYGRLRELLPGLDETSRIRLHLRAVEGRLRAAGNAGRSTAQVAARAAALDALHEYWVAGVFPHNPGPGRTTPIFIDAAGTHCAVAYLVARSGRPEVARAIAARENLAFLADMRSPELPAWVAGSGLTAAECALIQPAYSPTPCPSSGLTASHSWVDARTGATPAAATPGMTVRMRLAVVNASGTDTVPNVRLDDLLPTRALAVTAMTAPAGWTVDTSQSATGGELMARFELASFPPGGSAAFTIDAVVRDAPSPATGAVNGLRLTGCACPPLMICPESPGFAPIPADLVIPITLPACGQVKVIGGARGWVNPRRGEAVAVRVRACAAGTIRLRILNERGGLVYHEDRDSSAGGVDVFRWKAVTDAGQPAAPGAYAVIVDGPGVSFKGKTAVVH